MNAAIINDINYCKPCTPTTALKTTTVLAGPTALASTQTYFRQLVVLGCNTLAGVKNTGNLQLGYSSTAGHNPFLVAPGDEVVLSAPVGAKYDLSQVYIEVTTDNDGVVLIYS